MPIIAPISRDERRLMQKAIHKTHDKNYARRLTAMLMLHRGDRVSDVARTLCCARSSVGRWINWFTQSGVEGLKSLPAGRARRWPFEHICTLLRELVKHSPGDFGYQRSRWSTELLAIKINEITGCQLNAGTVRRWLPSAGIVWRRAAPTLRIRDPHKDEKMAAIHKALDECSAEHPVFYEDEVDIHLHPKIGADWQLRGQQKRVVTPGQNEKYYLAGALHSGTGKVSYVGGNSKSSALFISLLKRLKATYRRAKTITLIVDNYIIHKSRETQSWLKENPKFRGIYQPVYSPWVNHVERLWQALHDTITRNHQCRSCAYDYRVIQEQFGLKTSMSRKGNCYDNAPMESFWGTLKNESLSHYRFNNRDEAISVIREYIEIFYNRQRRHSRLGNISPAAFREKYHQMAA
ncbi:IS630 family transposase [Shigella flexneri]|nr:IS630 family transposase [Shigella flexneri]SRO77415.1 IS630 transposase [Shigella flexneri]